MNKINYRIAEFKNGDWFKKFQNNSSYKKIENKNNSNWKNWQASLRKNNKIEVIDAY